MTTRDDLKAIIASHGLQHQDIARLTGYSRYAVKSWLLTPESPAHRKMPHRALISLCNALSVEGMPVD